MTSTDLDNKFCDVADDLNITFAEVKKSVEVMVKLTSLEFRKSQSKLSEQVPNLTTQKITEMVVYYSKNKTFVDERISKLISDKNWNSMVNSMKSISKLLQM